MIKRRVTSDYRGLTVIEYHDENFKSIEQRIKCNCSTGCDYEMAVSDPAVMVTTAGMISPARPVAVAHLGNMVRDAVTARKVAELDAQVVSEKKAEEERKAKEKMERGTTIGETIELGV